MKPYNNKRENRKDAAAMTAGSLLFGLVFGISIAGTCHYLSGQTPTPIEHSSGEVIDTVRFPLWREADRHCGVDARLSDTWCDIADPVVYPGSEDDSNSEYPVGNYPTDDYILLSDETYIRRDAPGVGYTFNAATAHQLALQGCNVDSVDTDYWEFSYTSAKQLELSND